MVSQDDTAENI